MAYFRKETHAFRTKTLQQCGVKMERNISLGVVWNIHSLIHTVTINAVYRDESQWMEI